MRSNTGKWEYIIKCTYQNEGLLLEKECLLEKGHLPLKYLHSCTWGDKSVNCHFRVSWTNPPNNVGFSISNNAQKTVPVQH